ncbi:protein chibby homolog 1 [Euwallacea similis]|uniref:protein chibby homolog 1 n=1 Tax=Euwallacea similis TaxID=1736056 RepID=UPI00344C21E0
MPLFGNKFSPRKTPLRKSKTNVNSDKLLDDLVGENRSVKICLGEQELLFENGEWMPCSSKNGSAHKMNQKFKKRNHELQEENNLLKIKYELVLNMLSEVTAEKEQLERELGKARKSSKR